MDKNTKNIKNWFVVDVNGRIVDNELTKSEAEEVINKNYERFITMDHTASPDEIKYRITHSIKNDKGYNAYNLYTGKLSHACIAMQEDEEHPCPKGDRRYEQYFHLSDNNHDELMKKPRTDFDPESWCVIMFIDIADHFWYKLRGVTEEEAREWFRKKVQEVEDDEDCGITVKTDTFLIYDDDGEDTMTYLICKQKELDPNSEFHDSFLGYGSEDVDDEDDDEENGEIPDEIAKALNTDFISISGITLKRDYLIKLVEGLGDINSLDPKELTAQDVIKIYRSLDDCTDEMADFIDNLIDAKDSIPEAFDDKVSEIFDSIYNNYENVDDLTYVFNEYKGDLDKILNYIKDYYEKYTKPFMEIINAIVNGMVAVAEKSQ